MTLNELKAADQEVKDEVGLNLYKKLILLYFDQNGIDAELPTITRKNSNGEEVVVYSATTN